MRLRLGKLLRRSRRLVRRVEDATGAAPPVPVDLDEAAFEQRRVRCARGAEDAVDVRLRQCEVVELAGQRARPRRAEREQPREVLAAVERAAALDDPARRPGRRCAAAVDVCRRELLVGTSLPPPASAATCASELVEREEVRMPGRFAARGEPDQLRADRLGRLRRPVHVRRRSVTSSSAAVKVLSNRAHVRARLVVREHRLEDGGVRVGSGAGPPGRRP